jgi:hypothetical protein
MSRKLGVVARVAARQVGRSRRCGALLNAARTTASHSARVLRQLWLEVTGFVFLAIAVIGGSACIREYLKFQQGKTGVSRLILAAGFTLMFGWFGVSSFWRVRRKT